MRSRMSSVLRSNFWQELMSRVANRKSIGATMRGMTVIVKDEARQTVRSE